MLLVSSRVRGGSRVADVVVVVDQRGCTSPSQLLDCAVAEEGVGDHCYWA